MEEANDVAIHILVALHVLLTVPVTHVRVAVRSSRKRYLKLLSIVYSQLDL